MDSRVIPEEMNNTLTSGDLITTSGSVQTVCQLENNGK